MWLSMYVLHIQQRKAPTMVQLGGKKNIKFHPHAAPLLQNARHTLRTAFVPVYHS